MDRKTISNYGLIVVVIIIIAILIGLSPPFVNLFKEGVDFQLQTLGGVIPEDLGQVNQPHVPKYTVEDIEASNGHIIAIGKTKPEYVVAVFNENFSTLIVERNGTGGDGLMKDFDDDDPSPMTQHAATLNAAAIQDAVASVGANAFKDCVQIVAFTYGGATIDDTAMTNCQMLAIITLSESASEFNKEAFRGNDQRGYNDKVIKFVVVEENPYFSTVNDWLYNKDKTELISYPWGKIDTYVTIPDGTTVIDTKAFNHMRQPYGITLPTSLQVIKTRAFEVSAYSFQITSNVINVEPDAFPGSDDGLGHDYCEISFGVNADNPNYSAKNGSLYNKDKTILIHYSHNSATGYIDSRPVYKVLSTVTEIAPYAFSHKAGISFLDVPANVTRIASTAFEDSRINVINFESTSAPDGFVAPEGVTINYGVSLD